MLGREAQVRSQPSVLSMRVWRHERVMESMSWWLIAYITLLSAMAVGALILDLRDREPWWYTLLGLVCSLCGLLLCFAYAWPELARRLGIFLLAAIVFGVTWSICTTRQEVRKELSKGQEPPTTGSRRLESAAVLVALGIDVPSWILGLIACSPTFTPGG
jgi:hypothetical protein